MLVVLVIQEKNNNMKIIIPMAGMGKRLRPFTLTTPKPLIKIAGKSIVHRLVEKIINVTNEKVTDVAFVLGDFPITVNNELTLVANELNFKPHFVYQKEALGTAHAIYQANNLLSGKVVVAFADTLFNASFNIDVKQDVVIWTKKVPNPEQYGVVLKNDNVITGFKEKPKKFISDEAIIGIYYFKNAELLNEKIKFLLDNKITVSGEYQLTNALQNLLDDGLGFSSQIVDDWMDCGNKNILLQTTAKVLESLPADKQKNYSNNIFIEPVYIGKNVKLNNSVIGPNVTIEDNSVIDSSIIKNSMVLSNACIETVVINNSIIGNFSSLKFNYKEFSLGDYDEVNI